MGGFAGRIMPRFVVMSRGFQVFCKGFLYVSYSCSRYHDVLAVSCSRYHDALAVSYSRYHDELAVGYSMYHAVIGLGQ
ncbi:hypothetical protein D3C77_418510 [compost metagenome]